jgi:hypothetical protein
MKFFLYNKKEEILNKIINVKFINHKNRIKNLIYFIK